MFVVKGRNELIRFGLYLLLTVALVWYVLTRFAAWRTAQEATDRLQPATTPLTTADWPYSGESLGGKGGVLEGTPDQAQPVSAAPETTQGQDYFAEYRIERERTRGALGDRLKEVMNSPAASAEVQEQASQQYLLLGQITALEAQAEAMIKARGYEEVIVNMAEGSAQVVVKALSLDQQQAAQILDTVSRITGVKISAISVLVKE